MARPSNTRQCLLISLIIFLISHGGNVVCHKIDETVSNLVVEISTTFFFPAAAISSLGCTKEDDYFTFSKILSKNHILHNYVDSEAFAEVGFPLHKTIFFLDLECPRATEILLRANSSENFSAPHKWLILQNLEHSSNICAGGCGLEGFFSFAMYPDSEILVLQKLSNEDIKILSLYRPSPVRNMIIEHLGHWHRDAGTKWYHSRIASGRRRDLQRTPLKTSIVITNPDTINHLTDYEMKHVDTITKCNYAWLHHLTEAMNATRVALLAFIRHVSLSRGVHTCDMVNQLIDFNYHVFDVFIENRVTISVVDTWGYRDKNGSLTGLAGKLSRKEIDFGGTSMYITADRWSDVHYIPLSTTTRVAFIFRQPPLSFVSNVFILPFQRSVWIAISVLMVLILPMLFVTTKWEWERTCVKGIQRQFGEQETEPKPSDQLLIIFGVVTQQGFGRDPQTMPSRIVAMIFSLAALSLFAAYSANIVALLQSTTSISNLKDLLDSPIKCGADDTVYTRYYSKIERDPVKRAIIEKKIEAKSGKTTNWLTAEGGISRVRQGFFAFLIETGPAYKIVQETFEEDEKCGFRELAFFNYFDPTFAIIKQSPYKELIRVSSVKIWERGLKFKGMARWYPKMPVCSGRNKFVNVSLNECYFAFYVIIFGLLSSAFLFVGEVVWKKRGTVRRNDGVQLMKKRDFLNSIHYRM